MGKDKLLVFDLDETLIHSTKMPLDIKENFIYENYFVYKRPGLDSFIMECAKHFSIAIWSSAEDDYVNSIVKGTIPLNIELEFIWGRSECWLKVAKVKDADTGLTTKEYQNIKPLEKIRRKGFKLKNLLIIDDSAFKVIDNKKSYLIIKPFEGEQSDREFEFLFNKIGDFWGMKNDDKYEFK
ncbi:MAG: HAD family hydrolase [Flammeovirgaceae bacterium]|nr:HAD family hydrolase [Flammeovirgaceae bacterium]